MIFALSIGGQSNSIDQSPHKSGFITANDVKLHYLDWGGKGETMLFLHGIGDTPHSFDDFAPKFTNHFRVLGLTRRGHGESDVPRSGYDTATRVEDIRQFLNALNIERAVLVVFSAAGVEVTMFAAKHPDRIIKAVYLDAIFDAGGQVALRTQGIPPELDRPETAGVRDSRQSKALELMAVGEAHTDYKAIRSPVLAIVVVGYPSNMLNRLKNLPLQRRQVVDEFLAERDAVKKNETDRFRKELPSAQVVMLTNAEHACFIDREGDVLREMRAFLMK